MRTPRITRTLKTVGASALVAVALPLTIGQPASAAPAPASERYAARAGAQVAEVSLLGRRAAFGSALTDSSLEAVGHDLSATAVGTGSDLVSPGSRSVARFGDASARGGTSCATPALGPVLQDARSKTKSKEASFLPMVEVAPACGGASMTGGPESFVAESTGGRTQISVKLPDALRSVVGKATAQLTPQVLATPVGDLVNAPQDAQARQAVGTLNGLLGTLTPGVAVPQLEPRQTVGNLLERLQRADLLHIDLATATARNATDAKSYVAEALSRGGSIEVLPGFRGQGSAPLLRITVAESRAAVPVERASTKAVPEVKNAVVRIESELLGTLPVAGPPVVNGLVHGLPLSSVPGGKLPVAGGLLGGGLPFDQLVAGLGLRSGPGYLEVGPGQSVSVLCEGAVAPFCSEVSVGAAKPPETLPNGALHAESSTVTVHLLKGLDNLVPGTGLGTALAQPALAKALTAQTAAAGVGLGEPTGVSGVRLTMGGAVAEAGGARVLGAESTQPTASAPATPPAATPSPSRPLPHTGGLPFPPATVPLLLGSGAALRGLLRRHRA
jgi:hypothetical protein